MPVEFLPGRNHLQQMVKVFMRNIEQFRRFQGLDKLQRGLVGDKTAQGRGHVVFKSDVPRRFLALFGDKKYAYAALPHKKSPLAGLPGHHQEFIFLRFQGSEARNYFVLLLVCDVNKSPDVMNKLFLHSHSVISHKFTAL